MHTEPPKGYDAESLRRNCIDSNFSREIVGSFSVSRSKPGIYVSQMGSFEISTDKVIIGICVWEEGVVEVHTLDLNGETKEIETARNIFIAEAVQKIRGHVERHA